MLLEVNTISVHYGKSIALDEVSLEVAEGSVVSIIGANGAGKSTILKAISGLVPLISGQITFQNKRIDGMKVSEIVKLGVVPHPRRPLDFPLPNRFGQSSTWRQFTKRQRRESIRTKKRFLSGSACFDRNGIIKPAP